ncbi:dehydrodolichyl diphosphate synthase complex subunit Nus1 [Ixodes scapularis]|uniref:ditrans,polycis-polyprenyl diphosphate synthase [(2E,6E)-farnesyldiphosphate specific] n=1 Tax=Ixodes scapularis TaxID=6945 RepID=B7P1T7_IXOSC|nr:dehydrodolichyl diphosphate synthase complex subunit Nus1 [Ixodes scapularis]EEC00558.1 Nogo-B receptor, putative [Ixodes scapularis]|eukprot:XP_002433494.1 Nogo-B receptor, putative [Ixodes scapularis]
MFLTRVLCKLVLWLLHALLVVAETLSLIRHRLLHRLEYKSVYSNSKLDPAKFACSPSSVHRSLHSFCKVPKHVAVVIGESLVSYRDVANLVVWCLFARIPHVTLYDVEGVMKKNWSELYKEVLRSQKKHFGSCDTSKVVLYVEGKETTEKNGRNGYTHHVHVRLASNEDGRPLFAKFARKLCQEVKEGRLSPSDIVPDLIQKQVSGDWPDPDILLRFGKAHSVFGYQPWQLRLTEIISLPTHHNLRLSEFLGALRTYDNREQRFGK